jgi:CheY-like chemotaxis protein
MGAAMRILVVDDEEAFLYSTTKALRQAGYDVTTADDFRKALDVICDDKPLDLLFTDVVMPNQVNGFALGRMGRMRRQDLKVLYITGYDVPTHEAIGKVLRKPIAEEQLVDEVRRALLAN